MNSVLFFFSIITLTAVFFMVYRNLNSKKSGRLMKMLPLMLTSILIAVSLLGYSGVIDAGPYQNVWTFTSLISSVMCFISYLDSEKYHRGIIFLLKVIAAAAALEITVFNLPSYRTWAGNYPVKEIYCNDILITDDNAFTDENGIVFEMENEYEGTVTGADVPVSTVEFCIEYTDPCIQRMNVWLDIKDETQSVDFRENITESTFVTFRPDSFFVQCDLSGKVSDLRFRIMLYEGENVILKKIILNSPVPFDIQYIRFIGLVIISVFIYSLACGGYLSRRFSDEKKFCRTAAAIMSAAFMLGAFRIVDYRMTDMSWNEAFHLTEGNQITEELVNAFRQGHVYLDTEPEEFLSELDNPYDKNQREQSGDSYSWDHVFYNGKYYSYYGIAPVILLFLPYNLITGYYCSDEFAVLIFAFAAICGITKLYMTFIRKWFSDISSGVVLACLFILQLSSGLWYSVGRADFYEVSLSAGLAFISWGTYFFFESGIPEGGKISYRKTAAASLFFAVAVLCRPTLAVYCICAALFMLMAVPAAAGEKNSGVHSGLSVRRMRIKYILCAFIPMAMLGCIQMTYNYMRFDSVLDFGIQYSLTINDFTKSQFHLKFCAMAVYNYLFNPPVIQTEYPFVSTQFQNMYSSGYFYVDTVSTLNSSGLFMLVPLTWFWLAGRRAVRIFDTRKDKIKFLLKITVPCLIMPLIIIMSVWESGYAVRYMGDFSVEIIMGAYTFMLLILKYTQNQTIKKLITYSVCASVVWVIFIEGIQIVNQAFRYQENNFSFPEIAHDVERIISFWK